MTVTSDKVNKVQLTQIPSLLTNLNQKIKNFSVVDRQARLVGSIKDIVIDSNRQISFIISDDYHQPMPRLVLLRGQLVQKIDSTIKRVILIIDNSQVNNLPEYLEREMEAHTNTQSSFPSDDDVVDSHVADAAPASNIQQQEQIQNEEIIQLLGERLIVDRSKRKVGEVIVRKEIETRMVTVPVRHERLIVEQISPEHKELANIDLGEELAQAKPPQETPASFEGSLTVSGEFSSPKVASLLLNAIALERNHGCQRIQVTIAVENEQLQQKYREWFARTSIEKQDNGRV
ncbi:MAG: DUF2382 domain-containing protein [Calothrix sp. C42_A2020_038]|nr:DUF2382 domain-containing protein [Calothrix sp. C42_A2020_038]